MVGLMMGCHFVWHAADLGQPQEEMLLTQRMASFGPLGRGWRAAMMSVHFCSDAIFAKIGGEWDGFGGFGSFVGVSLR